MKIAISNIAWERYEEEEIIKILKKNNVKFIEVVPSKIFSISFKQNKNDIFKFKNFWQKNNFTIIAAQSILYPRSDLTIFANKEKREETLSFIKKIIGYLSILEIKAIVFGSPKSRVIPKNLSKENAYLIAKDFFREIGEYCKKYKIIFCLEPNPKYYGTNFLNTTIEAIEFVKLVDHPNIKINLDTGTIIINNEDIETIVKKGFNYIGYVHISEKDLLPISENNFNHQFLSNLLKKYRYKGFISIEMKSFSNNNLINIDKSIKIVKKYYL